MVFRSNRRAKEWSGLPNPQPDDPSSKLPWWIILNYKIKTIELQWSTAESFPESLTHGVISRLPVPGESVRDLRHLKEIICDAHYDLQVEDFLVCQIDAQRDLIKVSHMQEIDVIANSSVCKVVLMMSHQASRRQANDTKKITSRTRNKCNGPYLQKPVTINSIEWLMV